MEINDLVLQGIISFNGITHNALKLHPDQKTILYPMGGKIAIKDIGTGSQSFLTGHSNLISALCVSPCGKYVASGQINHPGFKAPVIIWDYKSRKILDKHEFHKVRIEDICISCQSSYVISLGGKDDGNILVWGINSKRAICGTVASTDISGHTYRILSTNLREECFLSAGKNIIKLWRIDSATRKLNGFEIKVGKIKRTVNIIAIDIKDEFAYCGTSTGDIIKARLNFSDNLNDLDPVHEPVMIDCYCKISKDPKKRKNEMGDLYEGGINALLLLRGALIVGAGDGTVELVEIIEENKKLRTDKGQLVKSPNKPKIKVVVHRNVFSSVTSMVMVNNEYILIGTVMCEIYRINLADFDLTLLITCHTDAIYDIAFPSNYSEVFATASKNDIRLWQRETHKELLRITVPNFICHTLCFSYDGTMIISGWNDGSIKVFTPQTGRLVLTIHKAHSKAVTAVIIIKKGDKIISGGCDARVKIWSIASNVPRLITVLVEHAGSITHLDLSSDELFVISSSTDGTCIIWDIEKEVRKQVLMAKTMFTSAKFTLNDAQVITCGSDRKIAYWETLDSSLVRELEGSNSDSLNCIDLTSNWQSFVTGGGDFIVKFWDYQLGEVTHIGLCHAAIITACKISPDEKSIVTVSVDGTIIIWQCPGSLKDINVEDGAISVRSSSSNKSSANKLSGDRAIKSKNKENVDLSSRSNQTVKSVHEGDQTTIPCTHDPSQPNQDVCSPKDEIKHSVRDSDSHSNRSVSLRKSSSRDSTHSKESKNSNK